MKTIYVDRNFILKYGFNKRLDDYQKHQEDFSGLNFEPKFYKTIMNCVNNYTVFIEYNNINIKCDIYISDNINKINKNAKLNILYNNNINIVDLIPYNNIYIVNSLSEIDTILDFYAEYDIETLEKKG